MSVSFPAAPVAPVMLVLALSLAGCASLPPARGYAETNALVSSRLGFAPADDAARSDLRAVVPAQPITPADAVRLAFAQGPRVREEFARLGLGRAEVEEARRLANPGFEISRLRVDGGGSELTRALTFGLSELLVRPSRMRLAAGELERLQHAVADALLRFAAEVEQLWYEAASAAQVAAMRELVASAADASATLARRFFDAGNIGRLQLAQEEAAASAARIAAVRAQAAALAARSALGSALGLPLEGAWSLPTQLAAPPSHEALDAEALAAAALGQRLDLAAAQRALALREGALALVRRWRWAGEVEVGFEQEREPDGSRKRGPTLALGLPLFDQGQGALARAQAERLEAQAALDAKRIEVANEARLGAERLHVAAQVVARYREALLPQREQVVARTQERVDYMLAGVFELIAARQEEFDAYQEYLEAVRDYWIARSELRRIVSGPLPGDEQPAEPVIGVEAILPPAAAAGGHEGHAEHGRQGAEEAADPHAGHEGHAAPAAPHEGHGKQAVPADPHAGHEGHAAPAAPYEGHGKHAVPADPHAGHEAQAAPADPHGGHEAHTAPADPHAGHRGHAKPAEERPADPAPRADDAPATHEHGDHR